MYKGKRYIVVPIGRRIIRRSSSRWPSAKRSRRPPVSV